MTRPYSEAFEQKMVRQLEEAVGNR